MAKLEEYSSPSAGANAGAIAESRRRREALTAALAVGLSGNSGNLPNNNGVPVEGCYNGTVYIILTGTTPNAKITYEVSDDQVNWYKDGASVDADGTLLFSSATWVTAVGRNIDFSLLAWGWIRFKVTNLSGANTFTITTMSLVKRA